jgi:hypothetical protein
MSPLVSRLARKGLQRGLVEGSRGWLFVGITAVAVGIARWLITEPPETVFESEIKPGQALEIRTVRRDGEGRSKRTRR